MDIYLIALIFLIISWVVAASNFIQSRAIPSDVVWAVWSIAIIAVFSGNPLG